MSQVHYLEITHDWEDSFQKAPVIVLVQLTGEQEIYKEWIFPRETHYQKNEETIAREWIRIYKVLDVIKSTEDRPITPYSQIKVWQWSEYGPVELEEYHRTGIIHSPFILLKIPVMKVEDNMAILFLEPYEDVWRRYNDSPEEGVALKDLFP